MERLIRRLYSPTRLVAVLTIINILNYVDRGIITGASKSIQGCLTEPDACHGVDDDKICVTCVPCNYTCDGTTTEQTGFGINGEELGFVQSSFMLGYSIAAIIFGNLIHRCKPFKMLSIGLSVWLLSAFLSGISGLLCQANEKHAVCGSFYFLLFARILSGAGEASMATLATPVLDIVLHQETKGFYLSIYYAAIPFGTALGFVYAGMVTKVFGRWEYAFLLEVPMMLPLLLITVFFPEDLIKHPESGSSTLEDHESITDSETENGPLQARNLIDENLTEPFLPSAENRKKVEFIEEIVTCLKNPIFMLTSLGFAQYTAVVAGIAFYGPKFLQDEWKMDQSQADNIFGTTVALAGFIGTALGGVIIDQFSKEEQGKARCITGLKIATVESIVGFLFVIFIPSIYNQVPFFALFGIGVTAMFTCNTTASLVTLYSVAEENRPMAMALNIIILHLLGDVPSPIVIGSISDHHSPRYTLRATLLWFIGTTVFWGFGWMLSKRIIRTDPSVRHTHIN